MVIDYSLLHHTCECEKMVKLRMLACNCATIESMKFEIITAVAYLCCMYVCALQGSQGDRGEDGSPGIPGQSGRPGKTVKGLLATTTPINNYTYDYCVMLVSKLHKTYKRHSELCTSKINLVYYSSCSNRNIGQDALITTYVY